MNQTYLVVTLIGWLIVFLLHDRTLRRTEISRVKDNLTAKIDELQKWIESHLHKGDINSISLEKGCVGRCVQIELYIKQLNERAGYQLVSIDKLSDIKSLEFANLPTDSASIISSLFCDFIEEIEESYWRVYLKQNSAKEIWSYYKYHIGGMLFSLILIKVSIEWITFLY